MDFRNWLKEAEDKLRDEKKAVSGQKEKAMAGAVAAALTDFCRQNITFARAVAEGRSFEECMKSVAAGVGNSISDIDAYEKAVAFYFPGAKIRVQMIIDVDPKKKKTDIPREAEGEEPASTVVLNLSDFF